MILFAGCIRENPFDSAESVARCGDVIRMLIQAILHRNHLVTVSACNAGITLLNDEPSAQIPWQNTLGLVP